MLINVLFPRTDNVHTKFMDFASALIEFAQSSLSACLLQTYEHDLFHKAHMTMETVIG